MAERKEPSPPQGSGIKVQRQRRRIYQEPVVEEHPSPQPEPAPPQSAPDDGQSASAQAPPQPIPESAVTQAGATAPPSPTRNHEVAARRIIRRYMGWSMGAGLVPLPLLDTLALGGLQVLLIKKLARLHGVDYSAQRTRALVAALLGGTGAVSLATGLWSSWLKALPVVGPSLGAASMPAASATATYAVGMVFLRHFQSGGTLLDFSPHHQAAELSRQLQEGQGQAADLGR